jgi:hypothetical protein
MTRNELIELLDGLWRAGWRIDGYKGWGGPKPEIMFTEVKWVREPGEGLFKEPSPSCHLFSAAMLRIKWRVWGIAQQLQ